MQSKWSHWSSGVNLPQCFTISCATTPPMKHATGCSSTALSRASLRTAPSAAWRSHAAAAASSFAGASGSRNGHIVAASTSQPFASSAASARGALSPAPITCSAAPRCSAGSAPRSGGARLSPSRSSVARHAPSPQNSPSAAIARLKWRASSTTSSASAASFGAGRRPWRCSNWKSACFVTCSSGYHQPLAPLSPSTEASASWPGPIGCCSAAASERWRCTAGSST